MRLVTDRLGPNISKGSEMIFDYLKATGESQSDLATKIETHGSSITVWMRGDQRPNLELAIRLRNVCKIPVDAWFEPVSSRFKAKFSNAVAAARAA